MSHLNYLEMKKESNVNVDQDVLDFINEISLKPEDHDREDDNPAWVLGEELTKKRPYTLADFERKTYFPDL